MDPALMEAMERRGEALLRVGDISGARRFFQRAAEGGSAAAALGMAETFDPRVLARSGAMGPQPDRAEALLWYRRAAALGSAEAESRIATLETEP
jgi:TPR repeat protein